MRIGLNFWEGSTKPAEPRSNTLRRLFTRCFLMGAVVLSLSAFQHEAQAQSVVSECTNPVCKPGKACAEFYRRADGSTRVEEPNRVVIVDNSSHTVTVLDTAGKVAQLQNAPLSAASGTKPAAALSKTEPSGISLSGSINIGKTGAGKIGSGKSDLGVMVIAGYSVHGIQQSTTIAANSALGNTAPITKTIQVWRSADLRSRC